MKKKLSLTFLTIIFLLITNTYASSDGSSGPTFLKIGVGARNIGMGETGSTNEDISGVYWNPAGLASLNKKELSTMYAAWFETINYGHLAYVHPTKLGIFAGAVNYLTMSPMDKYDNTGKPVNETFTATDLLLTLSYGRIFSLRNLPIIDNLPINGGINLKYISSKIENESANGLAIDLGSQVKLMNDKLKLGLVIQNLGTRMEFIKESNPLPLNIKTGASYIIPTIAHSLPLLLAVDLNLPNDNDARLNLGAETGLKFGNLSFPVRIGYNTRKDIGLGLTWGFGLKTSLFHFDYAFVPYGELGDTHRVSLGMFFVRKEKPPAKVKEFKGIALSTSSIEWSWKDVAKETGYLIYPPTGRMPLQMLPADTTYWIETNLDENTTYYRYIVALNNVGESPPSEIAACSTLLQPPAKVEELKGVALSTSSIEWSWEDVAKETGYLIYPHTGRMPLQMLSTDTTYWIETQLNENTSYSRYIVALNDAGESEPSDIATCTTKKLIREETIVKMRSVVDELTKIASLVHFDFDKDIIREEYKDLLNVVALVLKSHMHELRHVLLEGHTDSRGTEEYNQRLSQRRVESINRYLVERGVDSTRLSGVGKGESSPVADNATDEGRAKNRRVEFIFTLDDGTEIKPTRK
jgi:outer membrane protein OmpA-like peptidoglycan-associated protein